MIKRLLVFVALAMAIGIAFIYRDALNVQTLEALLAEGGAAGPALFVAIYALATVLFLPGSVLTIAGGAVYGPLWGTVYNLSGAMIGSGLAFLVARYLASDWVHSGQRKIVGKLVAGVDAEGWRFVAFTRLVPLFPFNALNYALGLTRIPFSHYLITSLVCMAPGTLAYTWLGHAGKQAFGDGDGLFRNGLIALALIATVAFLPRLVARMRMGPVMSVDVLKERIDNNQCIVLDVRTAEDFAGEQSHIKQAVNIPLEALTDDSQWLVDHQTRPIAIVCRTDRRSVKAAGILGQNGFTDVQVVAGGMTAWLKRGWPVA